jgi:hypothetical protein
VAVAVALWPVASRSWAGEVHQREALPAREVERAGLLPLGWVEGGLAVSRGSLGSGTKLTTTLRAGAPASQLDVRWDAWMPDRGEDRVTTWLTLGYDRFLAHREPPTRALWWGGSAGVPLGSSDEGPAAELHVAARARTGALAWWTELGVGRHVGAASAASSPERSEVGPSLQGGVLFQFGPVHLDGVVSAWWDLRGPPSVRTRVEGAMVVQLSRGFEVRGGGGWGMVPGAEGVAGGSGWWVVEVTARGG